MRRYWKCEGVDAVPPVFVGAGVFDLRDDLFGISVEDEDARNRLVRSCEHLASLEEVFVSLRVVNLEVEVNLREEAIYTETLQGGPKMRVVGLAFAEHTKGHLR